MMCSTFQKNCEEHDLGKKVVIRDKENLVIQTQTPLKIQSAGRRVARQLMIGESLAETHIDLENIYVVTNGALKIHLDDQISLCVESGEFVDLLDLWEQYGSGVLVQALTQCEIVEIDDALCQLLEVHPAEFVVDIVAHMVL